MGILSFLIARLNERATWTMLVPTVAAIAGAKIQPDQAETIITAGMAVATAITALVPNGTIVKPKGGSN